MRNSKIQRWPKGTKSSSCLIWLFRYLPTCSLVKLAGFSNRYDVTLSATHSTEPKAASLHWWRAERPMSAVFSLDTESRRAEHAAEL